MGGFQAAPLLDPTQQQQVSSALAPVDANAGQPGTTTQGLEDVASQRPSYDQIQNKMQSFAPEQSQADEQQQVKQQTMQLAPQIYQSQMPTGKGLKGMLQRFAYGFGQSAMHEAGLATDPELQAQSIQQAHIQAQTQLVQQQIQQARTMVPVTMNGVTTMMPQALASKIMQAQTTGQSRLGVAQIGADSRESVSDNANATRLQIAQLAQQGKVPNEIGLIMKAQNGDKDAQKTLDTLQKNRVALQQARGQSFAYARAATTPFSTVDENGNPTTISNLAAIQQGAVGVGKPNLGNALGKAALIGDIRGGIAQAKEYADVFDNPVARKQVAALLAQPGITTQTFLQSPIADSMDTRTQAATIQLLNLKENAMAMRSVLGAGQGSEDLRRAIQQTIPGAATPNGAYAKQQLETFENTLNRLSKGIPNLGAATQNALGGSGASNNSNSPAVGSIKKFPNGNIGKWDGKGYVLQGSK